MSAPTQAEIQEILHYDSHTGVFTWKLQRGQQLVGAIAGSRLKDGDKYYWRIGVNGKTYQAHRLVWLYVHGEFPKKEIDHINHNTSDNRLSNLREVCRAENAKNQKLYSTNNTGINGVSFCKIRGKFKSSIRVNGKNKTLGYFSSFLDACCARKSADHKNGYHRNHGRTL